MGMETYNIIRNLSMYSVFIPLLFFVRALCNKLQPASVKLLGSLLVISALSDFISLISYQYFKINPNPIILVYAVAQFILLSLVYRSKYTNTILQKITIAGIVLFVAFAFVNFFFVQGIVRLNSNAFTASSALLLVYSVLYFHQLLHDLPDPFIERIFMFWASAAVFIYFGTNLFLFATVDRVIDKNDNQFLLSWALHNGSNAFKNIVFAIAMFVASIKRFAK